jgi:folylpolyglutamate synthase/dihydropteroate synthase
VPGRFEVVGVQPLVVHRRRAQPGGRRQCAEVFFGDFQPDGRRVLVVGTLREPAEMLAALRADEFDAVLVCTAPSPRGVPAVDVARAARTLGCAEVLVFDTVGQACEHALRHADADDAVLVTGSLYVAGSARPVMRRLPVG